MVEFHIDRDSKRAIALSDNKRDRPLGYLGKKGYRLLGFDMGKAIALSDNKRDRQAYFCLICTLNKKSSSETMTFFAKN